MTKLIEISQLLNTPDQTYINGAVEGYLVQIRPPFKEGAPGKANLQDGGQSIDVSLWGQGFSHWEGKRVRFSGKGMKITEYKGAKQLSVGDKVLVESAAADSIPGDPAPVKPSPASPHASYPPNAWHQPHPQKPTESAHTPVHGATVGGALARAVDIAISLNKAGDRGYIEKTTRQLIEIQLRLESGVAPEEIPF